MIRSTIFIILFIYTMLPASGQVVSQPFEFQFENKTLRGLIEKPLQIKSRAVVLIIPGYGKTNFVEGKWFSRLRNRLVSYGLTVCVWDKMGCGKSDGTFDINQPVGNSAEEALAAIREIKKLKIPGSNKIGLWGVSRAGWICPLINQQFPVDFWISVSGTDDKENFGYLIKSNLLIVGKSEQEVDKLYQAWMKGHEIFCTQGSYEDCLRAVKPLMQDSTCRKLFGYKDESEPTKEGKKKYLQNQKSYTRKGYFDVKSGLWVCIKDFDKVLLKVNCPVLALFGENDSQVDWRKTKKLYEQTLGKRTNATLTIKTFKNCNHNLQVCRTCAYKEDLSALRWQACDGYYDAMKVWLKKHKFIPE
ncbi:hypothetical protein BKI52_34920 [marine bacterium AO1-C]|nr:hypothetical protein BKI52_34920 [marine bacterium AO1-C]